MKKEILGVKIDDLSAENVRQLIVKRLENGTKSPGFFIATVNPEFLVAAASDGDFREVLNRADLVVPDGVGLQIFGGVKNRVPGTDLLLTLCQAAADRGWSVGLFGAESGVAVKTGAILRAKFRGLNVAFNFDGEEADRILGQARDGRYLSSALPDVDLLFVALGMVKQENFLLALKDREVFRVGMGVGGAFNYISGRVPRAPDALRRLGLEWVFRLFSEPWRVGRVLRAVVVFPLLLLKTNLHPD